MDTTTYGLSPSPQQWLILLVLGAAGLVMLIMTRKKRPAGVPRRPPPELDSANPGEIARIRDDMERLLLELDRLSSSMNRQLDECHGRLQDAIKDADQRVFALRTLVKAVQERPEGASGAASATHPAMARTQVANLYNVESQPGSHTPPSRSASSDDAASAGGAGSKLGAASVAKASSMEPVDPRTRRIYELADQGLTAREIARRLEDHVGEVELILHLRELARLPGS